MNDKPEEIKKKKEAIKRKSKIISQPMRKIKSNEQKEKKKFQMMSSRYAFYLCFRITNMITLSDLLSTTEN